MGKYDPVISRCENCDFEYKSLIWELGFDNPNFSEPVYQPCPKCNYNPAFKEDLEELRIRLRAKLGYETDSPQPLPEKEKKEKPEEEKKPEEKEKKSGDKNVDLDKISEMFT